MRSELQQRREGWRKGEKIEGKKGRERADRGNEERRKKKKERKSGARLNTIFLFNEEL
jgi:hypothetical protein